MDDQTYASERHLPESQPVAPTKPKFGWRDVLILAVLGLILLCVGWTAIDWAVGGSANGDAPEPGSVADMMCDTNETGSGIVYLGGKHYVKKCLDVYPWDEQLR